MRVATLTYANSQGLGYLAKAFYDNGIITHPVIMRHSSHHRPIKQGWYPAETPVVSKRADIVKTMLPILREVDAVLFFETPFDWHLLRIAQRCRTRTILMPMHEWTPLLWPAKPDVLFCPSRLDFDYFKDQYRKEDCIYTPVPVDDSNAHERLTANKFLHNAGNMGCRKRNGTEELLKSVEHLNEGVRLTVRAQDDASLRQMASIVDKEDPRINLEYGEVPYEQLFVNHDVYVAPEKFNGLSLPLQEAAASGMPVMTTDRYPANTWLSSELLFSVESTSTARVSKNCYSFEECTVSPTEIARLINAWSGKDVQGFSQENVAWAQAHSWTVLKQLYKDAVICAVKGTQCPSF